jgi:hypothetical protein
MLKMLLILPQYTTAVRNRKAQSLILLAARWQPLQTLNVLARPVVAAKRLQSNPKQLPLTRDRVCPAFSVPAQIVPRYPWIPKQIGINTEY